MNELSKSICKKCTMFRDCYDMKDFSCKDILEVEKLSNMQIPSEVKFDPIISDYICPRCRNVVYTNNDYCPHCGGRLNG